ncbi:MAG: hypothetical protein ACLR56_13785 [Oscillospiraceae bacterium]
MGVALTNLQGFDPSFFKAGQGNKIPVNLMPLGGYCAMEGEDEESGDERAFAIKAGGALL